MEGEFSRLCAFDLGLSGDFPDDDLDGVQLSSLSVVGDLARLRAFYVPIEAQLKKKLEGNRQLCDT